MSLPVQETIVDLADIAKPLVNSRLATLSSLNSKELVLFKQAWSAIDLERRRQIVTRLVELSENNFELDFHGIFQDCLEDKDANIRSKAVEGLWESEDTSLIDLLINLLERDSSEEVQVVAAIAMGRFAMLAELRKLRPHHTSRVKQTLLGIIEDTDKSAEVRRRALEAAAPFSLPQVNEAITEAYHSDNPRLKVSAIYAMGRNCHRSWLPLLIGELDNDDAEMRYEAAVACGELGEEEAVPHLMELVNDPDTEVRLAAMEALGMIGGDEAKQCLEECLNNPNQAIREIAKQALYELEVNEAPLSFPDRAS